MIDPALTLAQAALRGFFDCCGIGVGTGGFNDMTSSPPRQAAIKAVREKLGCVFPREQELENGIREHCAQKADDRCIEDDDRLYALVPGLKCDRRVGDKAAMLHNCERFINNRCQSGGWQTYAELEREVRAFSSLAGENADVCVRLRGELDEAYELIVKLQLPWYVRLYRYLYSSTDTVPVRWPSGIEKEWGHD